MSVRTGVAVISIVSLGLLTAACSGASRPTGPSSSPSTTKPSELTRPAPGMSWLKVFPEQGAPRSAVALDVACLDNLGTVHSSVLDIRAVQGNPQGHQPWHLFGTATVRSDATPGRYQISTTCGADELSAAFTVVPAP
jgi:hypothetical protein